MSEQAEKEQELVSGTIVGITQKKADTWTVQVTPPGANYAKNLWTKDAALVEALASKIGQEGTFVGSLGAPYMVQGKEVRSWWIQSAGPDGEMVSNVSVKAPERDVTPAAAPQAPRSGSGVTLAKPKPSGEMTKEEWARKDSAKTAADALKHTVPSDPTSEDLAKFLERSYTLALAWHRSVIAERDDPTGEAVPF
jgi:hypothetical protein